MSNFTKGQNVTITEGIHAGKTAFFNKYSAKPGYAFVWFANRNMNGAHIRLDRMTAA